MPSIVVFGAGVCGLTTALLLKQKYPRSKVTILAQYLPGDSDISYTSPFAGANWHTFSEDDDFVLQEYDKPGYWKFLDLAENEPKAGIWEKKSFAFLTKSTFALMNNDTTKFFKWYRHFVKDFQIVDKADFPNNGEDIALGFLFTGVVITVPIYLNYLLGQCLERGVTIRRTGKLKNIEEAKNYVVGTELVVNCTGGSATQIEGIVDKKRNYPVRGQVLLVSNNTRHKISVSMFEPQYPNELLYIMPRKEGGCIIGGCTYSDDFSPEEDRAFTARLKARAIKYVPELINSKYQNNPSELDIVKVNVGLRPAREGGVRVEADPEKAWLIHNYGAGGGGYQGSYGFAQKVVKLVDEKIQPHVTGKL